MTAAVTLPADLIDNLKAALGPKGWSQDPQEIAPHVQDCQKGHRCTRCAA